ncbi:Hsp20/alpha crystallin family protein [Brevundimonas naejangsanensis]|uniref:Hsp20/alpha crystallin family protein n=1 Tax=Brevundimonas naejangsanensis TaxID=588932 RepID=A0A494RIA5_9CAUL|nr:Hsp20/alpha crystallin family protein [Brevundimonas naejangsanensis]AYG96267.1 Hsp20/alpha crystallin family protein [Brevundimonas naejangsanensis]
MPDQSLTPQRSLTPGAFERDPFASMRRELERLAGDFWRLPEARSFAAESMKPWSAVVWPSLELRETDKAYHVTADLAGVEQKDLQIDLNDNVLTLQGERRDERSAASGDRCYTERAYGRFERRIPFDQEVDADRVEARIKNGVLDIEIPKSERARSRAHRIEVKPG